MHDDADPQPTTPDAEFNRCSDACACRGPDDCADAPHRFISPFKVTLALGLVTIVGSFMAFKPDPQGALANPASLKKRIPPSHLRDIVMNSGAVPDAAPPAAADGWRSLGSLESEGLLITIETRTDLQGGHTVAYTVSDRTGSILATRAPIEDLQSRFPRLDWDSLTAAGPGRLMLADDPAPH